MESIQRSYYIQPINYILALSFLIIIFSYNDIHAGAITKVTSETFEYIIKKGSVEAAEATLKATSNELAEVIIRKGTGIMGKTAAEISENLSKMIIKHGDECKFFFKEMGHGGYKVVEEAGEKAGLIFRTFNKYGPDIITDSNKLKFLTKFGDDAVEVMVKLPKTSLKMFEKHGETGIKAFNKITQKENVQNFGIMLADNKTSEEMCEVIVKYGDKAMDFIWRNKEALAITTVAAKFYSEPDVFINGAKKLIVEPIVNPIIENVNWNLIFIIFASALIAKFIVFRPLKPKNTDDSNSK